MKKTMVIPAILIGILLSGGLAFAWSGGHGKGNCNGESGKMGQGMTQEQHSERMDKRLEKMGVILDLTDRQKEQLEGLFDQQWQTHQSMRTEMQASREDLRESKQGQEFNETEFRAKAQKHADLKIEMMVQHAKTKQQIFALLSSEQQQKAEKLREIGGGFHGMCGGDRDCDGPRYGHGKRGGKGYGQRCNN